MPLFFESKGMCHAWTPANQPFPCNRAAGDRRNVVKAVLPRRYNRRQEVEPHFS